MFHFNVILLLYKCLSRHKRVKMILILLQTTLVVLAHVTEISLTEEYTEVGSTSEFKCTWPLNLTQNALTEFDISLVLQSDDLNRNVTNGRDAYGTTNAQEGKYSIARYFRSADRNMELRISRPNYFVELTGDKDNCECSTKYFSAFRNSNNVTLPVTINDAGSFV